jgi:REP element-mobilizing transposase RayT
MLLNDCGRVVKEHWDGIPEHFPGVELHGNVVMPNHIHGVLFIDPEAGAACRAPTAQRKPVFNQSAVLKPNSLGSIIAAFKSSVTKRINELRCSPGASVWQRNYYEHIVKNDEELFQIRQYIESNPLKWELDSENLTNRTPNPGNPPK